MVDEADKHYSVLVTATAREVITEQVRFLAIDRQSPQNAIQWLDRVWTNIDGLEFLPLRHAIAEGYDRLPYLVRRIMLDNYLILFAVDEGNATVYVVGLRHGARLPEPSDLPSNPRT